MKISTLSVLIYLIVPFYGAPQLSPKKLENNFLTSDEKNVMKALLKVVEVEKPSPDDINNLFVLTRDLKKSLSKGSQRAGRTVGNNVLSQFVNAEGMEFMGIPENGDVIKMIGGEPFILTRFGELPMSGLDLVNDSERQKFLPTTKQLVKLMEKDYLNAIEMNTLLDDSEKLTDIITEAFIGQFG